MLTDEEREMIVDRPALDPRWLFAPAELAAAGLMAECAYVDGDFAAEEREAIWSAVREEFRIDEETAEWLVQVAEMSENGMWVGRPFSETLKRHLDKDEQHIVIRRLWDVALADGIVHPFEERLIARIARELGISDEVPAPIRKSSGERTNGREVGGIHATI